MTGAIFSRLLGVLQSENDMGLPICWVKNLACLPQQGLTPEQKSWLLDHGSTTARMSDEQGYRGQVSVHHQGWIYSAGRRVYQRSVVLSVDQVPYMVAFSQMSAAAMTSWYGQQFRQLGEQPLGLWLFGQLGAKRQQVRYACLKPEDALFKQVQQVIDVEAETVLYARRSTFICGCSSLRLMEVVIL